MLTASSGCPHVSSILDKHFHVYESLALLPLSARTNQACSAGPSPLGDKMSSPHSPTRVALTLPGRLAAAQRELSSVCALLKTHPGPFSREELCRLSHAALDRLVLAWQAVQLGSLALLGEADHLFDVGVEPHVKQGRFVVTNGDSLSFFDDEDAAVEAAAVVTARGIGPLGCVAYGRAGYPLLPCPAQPTFVETEDILEQMPQLHAVYGGRSVAFPGEDVLPCMDVLLYMLDAEGAAMSVFSCPAVYDTGAIDKLYVSNTAATLRLPSRAGYATDRTVFCHPCSEAVAFSAIPCSCGLTVTAASTKTCPLWTQLAVGNAPRSYLEWTDRPVFVVGAPVVSKRWGLSVLGTADGHFAFVKPYELGSAASGGGASSSGGGEHAY